MALPKLLYISTNGAWSGSEELWARSARRFIAAGHPVAFVTRYAHPELATIAGQHLLLTGGSPPSLLRRALNRLVKPTDAVRQLLQGFQPALVIVSQGNNYEAEPTMQMLRQLGLPFVTITQLVAEGFFWAFTDDKLPAMQAAYAAAQRNYFVSEHNLRLAQLMLGGKMPNAEVVANPCKLTPPKAVAQAASVTHYRAALVGRLDCWHKGFDLFLEVIAQPRWQARPITFELYGSGPHQLLIQQLMEALGIQNLRLMGHQQQVADIWEHNQLMILPSRMEGQALALIEAMACARPAVATDVGGAAELIDDNENGFLAPAPTAASIAEAMERAWARRDEWPQLGQRAAATLAARYPADTVADFNTRLSQLLPPIS